MTQNVVPTALDAQSAVASATPPIAVVAGDDELSAITLVRALRARGVSPLVLTGGPRRPIAGALAERVIATPSAGEAEEFDEALLSLGVTWRWRFGTRPALLATGESGATALARLAETVRTDFMVFGDANERDWSRFAGRERIADAVRGLNASMPLTRVLGSAADGQVRGRNVSCWSYRSQNGKSAIVTAEVHRRHRSLPTSVSTVDAPAARAVADAMLKALDFWGFATVDFVLDQTSDRCWLTDVKPHWTAPMELAAVAGVDLVRRMLDDLRGRDDLKPANDAIAGLTWIDPWTDLRARADLRPSERWRTWLRDTRHADKRALWFDAGGALLWRWVVCDLGAGIR